jgi:hypothetical protein
MCAFAQPSPTDINPNTTRQRGVHMQASSKSSEGKRQEIEAMLEAIAAYTGPVTICSPGEARAADEPVVAPDRAARWLKGHRSDRPTVDAKAKRARMRLARQRNERIAKNNAPLLKRIKRQEQFEARIEAERLRLAM